MITVIDMQGAAEDRLRDAEALKSSQRFDCSVYVCGYAIEIALKARICRTLDWAGFPETNGEFQQFQSFRTHDLDTLLRLSGVKRAIKSNHAGSWTVVRKWNPNMRYRRDGVMKAQNAEEMVSAVTTLMGAL
jgi:hypothetical protein